MKKERFTNNVAVFFKEGRGKLSTHNTTQHKILEILTLPYLF